MASFKEFIESEETEEQEDLRHTLSKLPHGHSKLIQGFSYNFQPGNTIQGDRKHVGFMDDEPKNITIAAPWNYPREFTFLHELAHRIWEKLNRHQRLIWAKIAKSTPVDKDHRDTVEEEFCMAYANFYAKNKLVAYNYPSWRHFIAQLPQDFNPEQPAST